MKCLYTLLLTTALTVLSIAPKAAEPFYPFTNEDLIRYGADPKFDGVYRLVLQDGTYCSSVALQTDLPFPVYVTAARCTEDGWPTLVKDGHIVAQANACFQHPFYEVAPQYDIAACYFPKSAQSPVSYPLYTGNLGTILTQPLISVGYEDPESIFRDCTEKEAASEAECATFVHPFLLISKGIVKNGPYGRCGHKALQPRQAFATYVQKSDTYLEEKKKNGAHPLHQPFGKITDGDTGNSLLWEDSSGQLHLIGTAYSKEPRTSAWGSKTVWFLITSDFSKLISEIGQSLSTKEETSSDLTRHARDLHLKQNPSLLWEKVVSDLQAQKETKYMMGLRLYAAHESFNEGRRLEAIRLLEEAAKQRHPQAALKLFDVYFWMGDQSLLKAFYWYGEAQYILAQEGNEVARQRLRTLEEDAREIIHKVAFKRENDTWVYKSDL